MRASSRAETVALLGDADASSRGALARPEESDDAVARAGSRDAPRSASPAPTSARRRSPLALILAAASVALAVLAAVLAGAASPANARASTTTDAALGAALNACPKAFATPAEAPSDRHSYTFQKLVSFADFVYLLCVDCERITAPAAWRGKVRLVDGRAIDDCMADHDLDHWHRATFSHAVAVADARQRGFAKVAVIEDDSRSDFTVVYGDAEYAAFSALVNDPDEWNFVRLGWRPFAVEGAAAADPNAAACPEKCGCDRTSAKTCEVMEGGCDVRSSDAYFINRRAYNDYVHRLQQGVVDYDVLPSFPRMHLASPMLSYQEKLDITMDAQRDLSQKFTRVCGRGVAKTVGGGGTGAKSVAA